LIDYLLFFSPQESFSYMETSPLPVKDCTMYAYARRSEPLSREGSLSCHTYLGFSGLILRTAPCSCFVWHTRGCGGPILTEILAGTHSIASCDTQDVLTRIFTGIRVGRINGYTISK
jgi:hypothetical protein